MSDNITLPREVVEQLLKMLEMVEPYADQFTDYSSTAAEWPLNLLPKKVSEAITALRKALAAEQPKPSSNFDNQGAVLLLRSKSAEIERLKDDSEALRRDAERYRYLRNRDPAEVLSKEGKDAGCWIDCEEKGGIAYKLQLLTGDDADAAIDAAMEDKR